MPVVWGTVSAAGLYSEGVAKIKTESVGGVWHETIFGCKCANKIATGCKYANKIVLKTWH